MQQPAGGWKAQGLLSAADPNMPGHVSVSRDGRKSRGAARTYFCDHCKSQQIAYGTHHGYEDLPPVTLPEDGGKQIHDGGDLSFHFHKLRETKVTIKFSWERKLLSVCARLQFCLRKQ